ncbi:helix-turn-helix domain-containing protein [Enterococcus faecalis]|nr:helix-turn-helix domain-containing protein [Enterococcus faecalis]
MSSMTYKPLDKLIESKGLKYSFVAKALGISYNNLWRVRVDLRKLTIVQMEKLAELLDVSFLDIYTLQKNFRNEVDKKATSVKSKKTA